MVAHLVVVTPPTKDSRIVFKIRKWPLSCPRHSTLEHLYCVLLPTNVDSSLFLPLPLKTRYVRPSGIDNGAMQVSCRWNAWCWFPPFTRPGVPGQPHSAVRACAHDESERGRIESDGGGAETRKG